MKLPATASMARRRNLVTSAFSVVLADFLTKHKLLSTLLFGIGLGLHAASASAVTATFYFPSPTVSGGVGSLNIAPYLGSIPNFASGTLDFSFSSAVGTPLFVTTTTVLGEPSPISEESCGAGLGSALCQTQRTANVSINFYSPPDTSAQSATVTVGGNTATVAAPFTDTTAFVETTTFTFVEVDIVHGQFFKTIITTDFYNRTITSGGSFNALLGLDSTALGVLNHTGLIGFDLQTLGTVTLDRIAFTADYTFSSSPVSPIPEPETYAMLLAGLGLLGFAARRRKQKEAALA